MLNSANFSSNLNHQDLNLDLGLGLDRVLDFA